MVTRNQASKVRTTSSDKWQVFFARYTAGLEQYMNFRLNICTPDQAENCDVESVCPHLITGSQHRN